MYCTRVGALHYSLSIPFTADNWLIVKRAFETRYLLAYEQLRQKSAPAR
jgi:hypothetical protein